jgi:hypothetical protein
MLAVSQAADARIAAVDSGIDCRCNPPLGRSARRRPAEGDGLHGPCAGTGGADFPYVGSVQQEFGTWRAAILAAGFDAFRVGCYGRDGEDPAVIAETVRLYRTGLSCAAVGERMGVTHSAVLSRLQKAGEPRRSRGGSKVAA